MKLELRLCRLNSAGLIAPYVADDLLNYPARQVSLNNSKTFFIELLII